MTNPSPRQLTLLGVIAKHVHETGSAPTTRELAEALGIKSTNAVADLLAVLVRRRLLEKLPRRSRGLRITELGYRTLGSDSPGMCPTCKRPL